jgi:hypothetical protein
MIAKELDADGIGVGIGTACRTANSSDQSSSPVMDRQGSPTSYDEVLRNLFHLRLSLAPGSEVVIEHIVERLIVAYRKTSRRLIDEVWRKMK